MDDLDDENLNDGVYDPSIEEIVEDQINTDIGDYSIEELFNLIGANNALALSKLTLSFQALSGKYLCLAPAQPPIPSVPRNVPAQCHAKRKNKPAYDDSPLNTSAGKHS